MGMQGLVGFQGMGGYEVVGTQRGGTQRGLL